MEFFVVKYPSTRRVFVDDAPRGNSGDVKPIETGTHTFDLGDPQDYMPSSQRVLVSGTSRDNPQEIRFMPMMVSATKIPDDMPAPKLKTAKRVGAENVTVTTKRAMGKKAPGKSAKTAAKKAGKNIAEAPKKSVAKKVTKKVTKKVAGKAPRKPTKKSIEKSVSSAKSATKKAATVQAKVAAKPTRK